MDRNRERLSWYSVTSYVVPLIFIAAYPTLVAAQEDESYFIPRRQPTAGVAGRGVYSKPFLTGAEGKARLGGYVDFEWRNVEGAANDTTRFHRLVPFIYANVTDRVSFATEIEFEDGAEGEGGGSYIAAEFAFIDFAIKDDLTLRTGAILTPLGKLNLVHDSPAQDATDRPLMHTRIIPTTLREQGIGLVKNVSTPSTDFKVGSEIYLTQGFKGGPEGAVDSKGVHKFINPDNGLKNARPHLNVNGIKAYQDNNSNQALVGRISISPDLGTELGLSWHAGKWDDEGRNGYRVLAADLTWQKGPIELVGEFATASLDRTAVAEAARVPGYLRGYTVQAGWHLYPGFLKTIGGDDDAHLTLFARYGGETIDDPFKSDDNERAQTVFGINYRPNATHTVFKFERQINEESGALTESDNDAWLFSVATYF